MSQLNLVCKFIRRYVFSKEAIILYVLLIITYQSLMHMRVFEFFKSREALHLHPQLIPPARTNLSQSRENGGLMKPDINWPSSERDLLSTSLHQENMGVYSMQGRRDHMEDRFDFTQDAQFTNTSLFGVFDGHGGDLSSEFLKKVLLKSVMVQVLRSHKNREPPDHGEIHTEILTRQILDTEAKLMDLIRQTSDMSGSTCLVAAHKGDYLTVANVGDSRGVMCDNNGQAVPMTLDHKPNHPKEKLRIERNGGFVQFFGVWRVAGILAVSRALGDQILKIPNYITAEPDVFTFNLRKIRPKFIILATDGLWDVFTNQHAVDFISSRLDEPFYGAKSLVLEAYRRNSIDNITVMVVRLDRLKFS